MSDDSTIRTRALQYTRTNWKAVLHYASWAMAALVTASVAVGRKQMDSAALTSTVQSLVTEVREMRGEVGELSSNQGVMSAKLDDVREDVRDFKNWKERVTGVADTFVIPKASHRARKP